MEKTRLEKILPLLVITSVFSGAIFFYLLFVFEPVTVESLRNDSFYMYDTPIQVSEFNLIDHNENPFTKEAFKDKWTLVFYGYTFCPDICPITMASIKQFYDLLDESEGTQNVQVAMISVDPNRDTPEKLASYTSFFNPEFIGLSGDYSSLYTMARQMNVTFSYVRVDDDNYLVTHNGEVMLLDPQGNNVGFFKAPYDPELMLENFLVVKKFLTE